MSAIADNAIFKPGVEDAAFCQLRYLNLAKMHDGQARSKR